MEPIEKRTRLIVAAAVAFALVFSGLFGYLPGNLGFSQTAAALGYEDYFDASSLMRVDVTADAAAWQAMLDSAASEEYIECDIALNGESVSCAGIRCKGNSSLSMTQDERYSFKINFGEYVKKQTFHGLDKMVLNNTQSDNTFIKEYLSYYLLNRAGAKTPLFAMAEIYVNGEYWGLYLAVECIDDSFIERTFSTDGGFLYKPDGIGGMGGGRGDQNNDFADFTPPDMSDFGNMTPPDGFNMGDNAQNDETGSDGTTPPNLPSGADSNSMTPPGNTQSDGTDPDGTTPPDRPANSADASAQTDGSTSNAPTPPGNAQSDGTASDSATPPDKPSASTDASTQPDGDASNAPTPPDNAQSDGTSSDSATPPDRPANSADSSTPTDSSASDAPTPPNLPDGDFSGFTPPDGNGGFGGSAQSAAALGYLGDDTSLYSDIFDYAKTNDPSDADKSRLIAALKALSEGALDSALDVDGAISWLAANALLVNDDGYLGSMLHNYYLYELNGKLTILPWDYNLAFGGFAGGSAVSAVNDPVDTPSSSERPLVTALLSDEDCLERYHSALYELATFLTDGSMDDLITELAGMIDESVRNDPTKECAYEDYLTAIKTLRAFCQARGESILGQLDGSIPSTTAGQSEDSSALIQVDFALSDMGAQGGGKGGFGQAAFGGNRPNFPNGQGGDMPSPPDKASEGTSPDSTAAQAADSQSPPDKPSDNDTASTASSDTTTGQPTDGDSSNRSASPNKPSNDGTTSTASGDTATGQPTNSDSSNRPASPDNPSNDGTASTAPTGQPTDGDSSNRPASPDKPSNDGAASTAATGQPTDGADADEAASGNSADSRQSLRAPGGMSFGARSESAAAGASIAQAAILDGAAVIALIAALILITRRRR